MEECCGRQAECFSGLSSPRVELNYFVRARESAMVFKKTIASVAGRSASCSGGSSCASMTGSRAPSLNGVFLRGREGLRSCWRCISPCCLAQIGAE
eukprot:6214576-Pleurochrysis_carterae.AAC.2